MPQIPSLRSALVALSLLTLAVSSVHAKTIFGWIERVKLLEGDVTVEAKLDTGADNSSINAPDPEAFEKDGEDWVRFTITSADDVEHTIERPVERMARIRSASGTSERYVVKMNVCLGDIQREVEVNLADRDGLSYEMLIGRSFMAEHVLVDSGPKHTRDPACSEADAAEESTDDDAGDDANNGNDN
ncbi:ATP-dependent zinc protease [Aquisalimonas sp.]|uniref:ATP-dependent zinc protease family protein n=1 Tax=unclassified Aquisalimonas TaxID=2644645 RepID=UPI0025BC8940|nr:ATP-dependent zinc protease [Aquisalimonas sp.]